MGKINLIILDCSQNINNQEQMSFISEKWVFHLIQYKFNKYFLEFLKVDDICGKGLFDAIIDR